MHYCKKAKRPVYDCDHYDCKKPDKDYRAQQGMHYCNHQKAYVYGCDHADCNGTK
jgi:hypothetical protein